MPSRPFEGLNVEDAFGQPRLCAAQFIARKRDCEIGWVNELSWANELSWRKEWDSNPRYAFTHTRFPSVRLKPLGHPSRAWQITPGARGLARRLGSGQASIFNAAKKALCGISTLPNWRIRFLPSFCFSSSLRLRLMSPP